MFFRIRVNSIKAGLVVKGLSTGAISLIGVERLAALTAKISKFANALKQGVLSVVKVGRKPLSFLDEVTPLVKTGPNEAFYWSGRVNGKGVMDEALEIAKSKGGTTLEGIIDNKKIKMPKWEDNPKVWEDVSAAYANQASGEVRAVLGTELRPGNVWETIELPRLKANPNVSKITVINAETLEETIIFVR